MFSKKSRNSSSTVAGLVALGIGALGGFLINTLLKDKKKEKAE